jgi:hypothetical protein
MVPGLGANDLALHGSQHLLGFGQAQAQTGDVAQVTGPRDFHHIRAPVIATSARFHQPQNPGHARHPTESLAPQVIACPFQPPKHEAVSSRAYAVADVGRADFWLSSIASFRVLLPVAGTMTQAEADAYVTELERASAENRFFGACNFYTYVAQRDT